MGKGAAPLTLATYRVVLQTRLEHDGTYVRRPEFQTVFRRLLGRLSSLVRFHCGAPLDVDFRGLIDAAAYESDLKPFWPYLVFGQWAHVGKGATFGLGGYPLERPGGDTNR